MAPSIPTQLGRAFRTVTAVTSYAIVLRDVGLRYAFRFSKRQDYLYEVTWKQFLDNKEEGEE